MYGILQNSSTTRPSSTPSKFAKELLTQDTNEVPLRPRDMWVSRFQEKT